MRAACCERWTGACVCGSSFVRSREHETYPGGDSCMRWCWSAVILEVRGTELEEFCRILKTRRGDRCDHARLGQVHMADHALTDRPSPFVTDGIISTAIK